MLDPIFTDEENQEHQLRLEEARKPLPGEARNYRGDGTGAWTRSGPISNGRYRTWLTRISDRPHLLVDYLLVVFLSRGRQGAGFNDQWKPEWAERLAPADTPDNRRLLHTILSAMKVIPQSWATSATARYFRGTGKQGKPPWSDKIGSGLLGSKRGWKQYDTTPCVRALYAHPVGPIIMPDDSVDPYSEEGWEVAEEGGNRFAATRKERDDDMIDILLGILEERGLGDPPEAPPEKTPKPRKVRIFKPDDRVTSATVRDLPEGSHFRYRQPYRTYDRRGRRTGVETRTFEGVYMGKGGRGIYLARPVMEGKAFAPMSRGVQMFEDAEYIGPWTGETIDIEPRKWKPC